jgi:hypothetical protein
VRRPSSAHIAWGFALLCAVVPLWSSQALPLVDLPQHLHLISVLHRLDDASTLYPEMFAQRPELTPYLGYYYAVSALHYLMPLEVANRLFLSAYVAGLALSLGFFLRALRRPSWPALLALPFAYGDSFAWGFVNFCAALPLAITCCALFVLAITDPTRRTRSALGLGFSLTAVLLFHVQVFAWLAGALPLLLLMTPAPEGPTSLRARLPALVGVLPGVLLFLAWMGTRLGHEPEIAPGEPWKAWGPMLSEQNLAYKSFDQNLADLVLPKELSFPILGSITSDGSDQYAVRLVFALALAATLLALVIRFGSGARARASARALLEGHIARLRLPALFGLSLAMFFLLPFDIRGYSYYMNTRYSHLAAALLVCCVPPLSVRLSRWAVWAAALAAPVLAVPLTQAFVGFDEESRPLRALAAAAGEKPRVMGLIYRTSSRHVRYPVYIHAACDVARAKGGLTNFSFAFTPHSPLMYPHLTPPTFPSEWHPEQMHWQSQGSYYDHFVLRGRHPQEQFGALLGRELYIAAEADDFYLVRKR